MDRAQYINQIKRFFRSHPIVGILGPRQCGKTTLAHMFTENFSSKKVTFLDLENPTHLARMENPMVTLEELEGLIVIDEIQRQADLFEVLRVLVDRKGSRQQFLILGSASRDLIRQSSESLAGRIAYIELPPFGLSEVGMDAWKRLWLRGGFPRSYLARSHRNSQDWRNAYITTFLERDIPALGFSIPARTLRRFWLMLTHYHGQTMNYSEFSRSFGMADNTLKSYLDLLSGTFMVRQLPPWFENIKKRQIKAPKIYLRDSGLLHSFLGIGDYEQLQNHPKLGASWEGFVIEEIIKSLQLNEGECYFWSAYGRAEIDLLVIRDGKRMGIEVKYTDKPKITNSLKIAIQDLKLDKTFIVYPGNEAFSLAAQVQVIGTSHLQSLTI